MRRTSTARFITVHHRQMAFDAEFQLDLAQQLGFLRENGSLIGLSQEVAHLAASLANTFYKTPESASRSSEDGHWGLRTEDRGLTRHEA